MSTIKQSSFFDIVDGRDVTEEIGEVRRLPNGYWQATILHGWWVRQAKSKKAAINAVIKAREDEFSKGA